MFEERLSMLCSNPQVLVNMDAMLRKAIPGHSSHRSYSILGGKSQGKD